MSDAIKAAEAWADEHPHCDAPTELVAQALVDFASSPAGAAVAVEAKAVAACLPCRGRGWRMVRQPGELVEGLVDCPSCRGQGVVVRT